MDDLNDILNNITEETYLKMIKSVENNFNISMKYKTAEDYLINYNIF